MHVTNPIEFCTKYMWFLLSNVMGKTATTIGNVAHSIGNQAFSLIPLKIGKTTLYWLCSKAPSIAGKTIILKCNNNFMNWLNLIENSFFTYPLAALCCLVDCFVEGIFKKANKTTEQHCYMDICCPNLPQSPQ